MKNHVKGLYFEIVKEIQLVTMATHTLAVLSAGFA
jgi:hypothetical protein